MKILFFSDANREFFSILEQSMLICFVCVEMPIYS
jgi:hypothetical protein